MHFFQLAAAWMFPCAVCATMAQTVATAAATDAASTVEPGSSPSPAFGPAGGDEVVSSPSASSSTSSSSSFSLMFGARSGSSNSARSAVREDGATAAPKGHAVRRCLRRFARKLQRAGAESVADERPGWRRGRKKSQSVKPDRSCAAPVDGTAREREEAVGSALAYCKETSRHRQRCTPPLPPSPSFDGWLQVRPEEETGTETAAAYCQCEVQGTSSSGAPHHGFAACDAECSGGSPATAETQRGPASELGKGDAIDGLDRDVLRITSYLEAKYAQCTIEE